MSSLCLVLTGIDIESAVSQAESCVGQIDMIELNIDRLAPEHRCDAVSLPNRLSKTFGTGFPLILSSSLVEDGREQLLSSLIRSKAWSYLDLEWNKHLPAVLRTAQNAGMRIIRSRVEKTSALLDRPLAEIALSLREMAAPIDGTASIPRLEVPCDNSRQLLTLARLAAALSDIPEKLIAAAGPISGFGGPTLVLAERFGSLWTYVSGPKQLPPKMYRFRDILPTTPVYGVTGNPIAHSRSPELHNGWLKTSKLPGTYLPLRSDNLAALLETCDLLGISGLSVTVPHKKTALKLSEYAEPLAQKIGAANTLIRAGDGWRARNTDAAGFLIPLLNALNLTNPEELKGKKVLIIGAGGAAKAVVHSLTGTHMVLLNRTLDKAEKLAASTENCAAGPLSPDSLPLINNVDIVVQTTSVGMHPDTEADPIPWWNPKGCTLVYDLVYNPEETVLLKRAKAAGTATLNGTAMLRAQAALQFEYFTGFKPPVP